MIRKTDKEYRGFTNFDIGLVTEVIKEPLSQVPKGISDKFEYSETIPEITHFYVIDLETRFGCILAQGLGVGDNNLADIMTYPVGTRVLVGYLGENYLPFILKILPVYPKNARLGVKGSGIQIPALATGEIYRSSTGRAIIYQKKDGGVLIKGSRGIPYTGDMSTSFYIEVGGEQKKNEITGKRNVITIGIDQTGNNLAIDEDGNLSFSGRKVDMTFNTLVKNIQQSLDMLVQESANIAIGKDYNLNAEENVNIAIGKDYNLNAEENANTTIGKDYNLDVQENIVLSSTKKEKSIKIGSKDSDEPLVLGTQFKNAFDKFLQSWSNNSANIGLAAGSSVALNPILQTAITKLKNTLEELLSKKVLTERE